MTDTTPLTVSEPPSPAETVAPADPWTVRLIVGGMVLVLVLTIVGTFVLAGMNRIDELPSWVGNLAVGALSSLGTLATTRALGRSNGWRSRPR